MIIFVRHGQTDMNVQHLICGGKTDIPLNKKGVNQARVAAKKLKNCNIDVVFCSTMVRARQTAEEILKFHKKTPIFYDDRLIERDWGEFEKLHDSILPQNHWNLNAVLHKSIETFEDIYSRVADFYNEVAKKYPNKTILIVAHDGVAKVSRAYFQGFPEDKDLKVYSVNNAEVLKLSD